MTIAMASERIVVTGGTGFIGRNAVRRLSESNDVHVLVRDPEAAEHLLGIASDHVHGVPTGGGALSRVIASINPTVVFHLATLYERSDPVDPGPMIDANIRFGAQVLAAVATLDRCDVVIAGSHLQYRKDSSVAFSMYAATKRALVEIARYLGDQAGLRWIETVFYEVYGPGDTRRKLLEIVIKNVRNGAEIHLPKTEPLLHLVHVDDAVDALVTGVNELRSDPGAIGRSVFVSADHVVTPRGVVDRVSELMGIMPNIAQDAYVLPVNTVIDPIEGPRPFGWSPRIDLGQGLTELIVE